MYPFLTLLASSLIHARKCLETCKPKGFGFMSIECQGRMAITGSPRETPQPYCVETSDCSVMLLPWSQTMALSSWQWWTEPPNFNYFLNFTDSGASSQNLETFLERYVEGVVFHFENWMRTLLLPIITCTGHQLVTLQTLGDYYLFLGQWALEVFISIYP